MGTTDLPLNRLMGQSGDSHALTRNRVRHHRGGGVTHGDAGHGLRHRHGHRGHGHGHWCHRNRWRHPLGDGLCESGGQGGDLRVEVRRRGGSLGGITLGRRRGAARRDQLLLDDGPRLQSSAAQGGVSLSDAVVVGTYGTHGGHQALLSGCGRGGQRHHLGLASELGVLLQKNLICGNEI